MEHATSKTPSAVIRWIALLACLLASGCAGYRGGWESFPYVGEAPPAPPEYRTAFEARQRSEVVLPGLRLGVRINNQVRTYDSGSTERKDVQAEIVEPGKTRVSLRISGHDGEFVFRPKLATLAVGGRQVAGAAGFEFAMWDAAGKPVRSGGAWGFRPTADDYALAERGRVYELSIDFPVPVPSPESRDVSLDLSKALEAKGKPALPPIRFLPVRWKEGYG